MDGNDLRAWMDRNGYDRPDDLALALGVTRTTVYNWLARAVIPRLTELALLGLEAEARKRRRAPRAPKGRQ